jgi:pseudouridine-5'-phosphate glycosidase
MVLDLPRTLELLETLGVPVVGYRTDDFPAFYVRASGLPVPRVDEVAGLAGVVAVQAALGWPSGVVVGNPPPGDLALPEGEVEAMLRTALAEARAGAARGKDETPFLLRRLAELSGGRTVRLNEALVLANARLAAELAVALAGSGADVPDFRFIDFYNLKVKEQIPRHTGRGGSWAERGTGQRRPPRRGAS